MFRTLQYLIYDLRQLRIEVYRHIVVVDDVDVALVELSKPTFLRTLTAPYALNLVALEREYQVCIVLRDVARERHGQIVVQGDPGVRIIGCPRQPMQGIYLLVDIAAFGRQHRNFFD